MRTKLGLTDEELMSRSWIELNLEMRDFPYYDYKAKKKVSVKNTGSALAKLLHL